MPNGVSKKIRVTGRSFMISHEIHPGRQTKTILMTDKRKKLIP